MAKYAEKDIETILDGMREVHRIQGSNGNWDYDPYMFGLYIGIELMLSMAEGRPAQFREAPDVWRKDIVSYEEPVPRKQFTEEEFSASDEKNVSSATKPSWQMTIGVTLKSNITIHTVQKSMGMPTHHV